MMPPPQAKALHQSPLGSDRRRPDRAPQAHPEGDRAGHRGHAEGGAVNAAQHIHDARVYLAMARYFRLRDGRNDWPATLLQWAANARRRAMAERVQGQLFEQQVAA